MARFTNQAQLRYGNNVANSNIAVGEILEVLSATKTAVKNTYNQNDTITYVAVSYTHLQRGSTILKAQGGYKQDDIQVVMCACNSKEMYQVRKSVKDADPDSFIVVVESHEVHGEGFKMTNIGEAEN